MMRYGSSESTLVKDMCECVSVCMGKIKIHETIAVCFYDSQTAIFFPRLMGNDEEELSTNVIEIIPQMKSFDCILMAHKTVDVLFFYFFLVWRKSQIISGVCD